MKKYFLSLVAIAAAMLFATSCQESLVEPQVGGTTTFTVQVPNQMGTKAIGEASSVTQLLVDVYPFGVETPIYQALGTPTSEGFEVELNLIQDQKYDILFWAQTKDGYVKVLGNETDGYSFGSLREVPMNSNYLNNDNGAAFFHAEKGFVPSGTSTTITLVRPFAQLNLGTTDLSLKPATGDVKLYKSLITVKGVATNFNVYEGLGYGNKDVVYVYGPEVQGQTEKQPVAVPEDSEKLTIGVDPNAQTYNYVSMNYLAVLGDTKAVVDVDAKIIVKDLANNGEERTIEHSFKSVPIQENYRTNIVGNLISSTTDFIVEVNDNWVGDYTEEYVAPGIRLVNGVYEITSEEGLWSFAELVNGGTKAGGKSFKGETVKLTCDIDLNNEPWTPISVTDNFHETFRGTFDGQGHTITGLKVNGNDVAGLFGYMYSGTIQNVIIDGATINSNHYAGGVVGWVLNNNNDPENPMIIKNCQVKNSTIASTPEQVNGAWDNGDKVGGIVGYAAYVGGDVLADDKNTVKAGAGIFNCSVENTTIKAYRDFGGIVGYAKSVKIEQPTIQNVTLEQDLTNDYQTPTPTTFGQIIGRDAGGNIVNGVSLAVTVTNSAQLQQVVNSATTDITVELGENLEGNITVNQKRGIHVTILGNGKNYKGGIHIFGNGGMNDRWMTIKDINFDGTGLNGDQGCIYTTGAANGVNSYACNVTIDNCKFTGPGVAAIRQNVGGERNWTIKNCIVDNTMHSFLQVSNTNESLIIENCKVYSKNGANLNSTCYATFIDCEFDVKGYAVRLGVTSGGNPDAIKEFNFTDCTLKSKNDDGDAVVIIRKDAQQATLNFVNTTLEGDPQISGAVEGKTTINGKVARIGDNREYYSIDQAIAAWTNNTTLTLLADVTLSDVVKIKSTEHHILNLGTFTMTAASGKHAIEITCEGRSSASYALTINADATNPGGITATGKSCIYYKKSGSTKDRPIILINNGVFTGSYSINSTSNGNTNCPQIWINGGVFNSYMNLTKNMLRVSGGTFHASINCTGDSSAYREIKGGRFKSWQFMTADAPSKFWVGTAKETYDVGVYVDDEGYLVVGGPVITEFDDRFAAKATNPTKWSSYLKYSSAAEHGLYYTNAELAIKKHGEANVVLK